LQSKLDYVGSNNKNLQLVTCHAGFRKAPPKDYLLKIDSFSSLLESGVEKYETKYFNSGGNRWSVSMTMKMSLRSKNGDVGRHISFSLAIEKPTRNILRWEVNVNVKFFVLDQLRGRYLIISDTIGEEIRFDWMKLEWLFPNLISHDTLNDPSKGYLVNDCCLFGVELFVLGNPCQGETVSWIKQPKNGRYTWKIDNYSSLNNEFLYSPVFTVDGQKWKLMLYPKGSSLSDGKHLCIFICREKNSPERNVFAHYKLRMKDQITGNHYEQEG
ncbi:hypothetical protein Tsubulata_034615, partial [Turnera subulata]